MQYMLMCCIDENHWHGLPQRERDRVMQEYGTWIESIRASRNHVATGKLRPSATATTVRWRNGKPSVSDGPFAETKEMLGGILILEAASKEEAIRLMTRHPGIKMGSFEIRPADEAFMAEHPVLKDI